MIPKILHHVWFGGEPSEQISAWMKTARDHHPDWEYHLWNESNVYLLGLDYNQMVIECGHSASFSGLVRLEALRRFGGIYFDGDCEVLKPFDPLLEHSAFAAIQDYIPSGDSKNRLSNAVMGAEIGNDWINWQHTHFMLFRSHDPVWSVHLASQAPRDSLTVVPTPYFMPFHWDDPPEKKVAALDSYCIHHFIGSWCQK